MTRTDSADFSKFWNYFYKKVSNFDSDNIFQQKSVKWNPKRGDFSKLPFFFCFSLSLLLLSKRGGGLQWSLPSISFCLSAFPYSSKKLYPRIWEFFSSQSCKVCSFPQISSMPLSQTSLCWTKLYLTASKWMVESDLGLVS